MVLCPQKLKTTDAVGIEYASLRIALAASFKENLHLHDKRLHSFINAKNVVLSVTAS